MPTFIDPALFATLPNNPNLMGMTVTLTEPVDAQILREAVELVRKRFPYFYARPKKEDANLVLVPNDLPMVVRETWEPTLLLSTETNYHIVAWKCEGKRLAAEVLHIVTDGSGFMPYFKSVLYCYLCRKYGIELDPTGFRLPGDEIPETETGNPFPEDQIDAIEAPFYHVPEFKKFAQIQEPDAPWRAFCIKLPEDQVMKYCGELDASPNALVCVTLARAIRKVQPANDDIILGGVAINHKAILGNYDNYRGFSNLMYMDYKPADLDKDLSLLCTVTRGKIMLQSQPENVLYELKKMKEGLGNLNNIPSIGVKMLAMSFAATGKRTTFTVSYAASRGFGPLDPYIEELYLLAEPASSSVICEIACINHAFFLHFEQCFESEAVLEAFLDELREVGIEPELIRKEAYQTSDVRYDDVVPIIDKARSALDMLFGSA